MRPFSPVVMLLLLVMPAATDQAPKGLAIVGATVIPMTEDNLVLPDHTVVASGDELVAVGPSSSIRVPAGIELVDGRGKFLVPGLADLHVHLEYFDNPAILGAFTANGVTTVRNMDGRPYVLDWKQRVAAGSLHGPRIYTAGPLLDGDPPVIPDNTVVTTAADARAAVEAQLRDGYDFIKVYSALSQTAYDAIVDSARSRNADVAGHVPRAVSLSRVLDAGQRSIEHLSDFAAEIQAGTAPGWSRRYLSMALEPAGVLRLAERLAKRGVWVVPTLVQPEREVLRDEAVTKRLTSDELLLIPPDARRLWERRVRGATARMDDEDWALIAAGRTHRLQVVRALYNAGVNLLAGTDTPNPFVVPGFSLHDELSLLVESGLKPAAALGAATRQAGRYFGAEWGVIRKGAPADLVLLSGNPLQEISNTRRIEGVAVRGHWMGAEERTALLHRLRVH